MEDIHTDDLFLLRDSNYKLATLLLAILIAYAYVHSFLSLCKTLI